LHAVAVIDDGTDPRDAASVLRVSSLQLDASAVPPTAQLGWSTIAGKPFTQRADDPRLVAQRGLLRTPPRIGINPQIAFAATVATPVTHGHRLQAGFHHSESTRPTTKVGSS
jgi:hypothetical protein